MGDAEKHPLIIRGKAGPSRGNGRCRAQRKKAAEAPGLEGEEQDEDRQVGTGEALESLRGWSLILSLMRSHLEALRKGMMAYFFVCFWVWGFFVVVVVV